MSGDALFPVASPRPWRVAVGPEPACWITVRSDDDELLATTGGLVEREKANANLAALAVNEYEALLYVEQVVRASHGKPIQGAAMGCETCNALARLDALRTA